MSIHINRGVNRFYMVRWKDRSAKKYTVLKRKFKSKETACRALLKEFLTNQFARTGEVCLCADYYPPTPVLEIKRP